MQLSHEVRDICLIYLQFNLNVLYFQFCVFYWRSCSTIFHTSTKQNGKLHYSSTNLSLTISMPICFQHSDKLKQQKVGQESKKHETDENQNVIEKVIESTYETTRQRVLVEPSR